MNEGYNGSFMYSEL